MNGARRLAGAFWLAFCLLLSQQVVALHALGHAVDRMASQERLPPAPHCDDCFPGATLSGAASASPPQVPPVDARSILVAVSPSRVAPAAARLAFHSRAPPAHS